MNDDCGVCVCVEVCVVVFFEVSHNWNIVS